MADRAYKTPADCHSEKMAVGGGLCRNCYRKRWYKKNPNRVKAYKERFKHKYPEKWKEQHGKRSQLKRLYGITPEQYNVMLIIQNGVCAVCGVPPQKRRLAVEHDHQTGRVRGLVCHTCNRLRIGINTVATAKRVLEYLESEFDGRKIETKTAPKVRGRRKKVHQVREEFLPAEIAEWH